MSQISGQSSLKLWDMKPSPYDHKIAEFLRKRRGKQTYRDFAPKLGMSRSTLHRLENLEQSITIAKLHAIALRLRTSIEEILQWKKSNEQK